MPRVTQLAACEVSECSHVCAMVMLPVTPHMRTCRCALGGMPGLCLQACCGGVCYGGTHCVAAERELQAHPLDPLTMIVHSASRLCAFMCACLCPLCYQVRERDWPNVVTCHAGDPAVYTWRLAHFAMGDHVLLPPPDLDGTPRSPSPATAVAVSCCGNFAIVGSSGGTVDRYNLQSGHHRGAYMRRAGADGAVVV